MHSKVRLSVGDQRGGDIFFYRNAVFKTYDTGASRFPPSARNHMKILWLCMEKDASLNWCFNVSRLCFTVSSSQSDGVVIGVWGSREPLHLEILTKAFYPWLDLDRFEPQLLKPRW